MDGRCWCCGVSASVSVSVSVSDCACVCACEDMSLGVGAVVGADVSRSMDELLCTMNGMCQSVWCLSLFWQTSGHSQFVKSNIHPHDPELPESFGHYRD